MGTFADSAGLGVRNHYGPRDIYDVFGGETAGGGIMKQAEWVFSYDDLPTNTTGQMEALVPAGAFINRAWVEVLTAMTGTTGTLTIGLEEPNGTVINTAGIDSAITQAALVANAWVDCNGVLINTGIAVAGQLLVSTGGTVTGGKFKVVIEYQEGNVDASGNYTAGGTKG